MRQEQRDYLLQPQSDPSRAMTGRHAYFGDEDDISELASFAISYSAYVQVHKCDLPRCTHPVSG